LAPVLGHCCNLPPPLCIIRIMGKRSASTTIAGAAKKEKLVNPAFAEIQDALKQAEHLPANCQAMLAAMVPATFTTAPKERSEHQATVIQWVEDALCKQQAKLMVETNAGATKLSELEATKAERSVEVKKAEATLAEKKNVLLLKKNVLAEAMITMIASKKLLAEKQEEQQTNDADFLAMKKEQHGLSAAFVEHFKAPMEAGEALHYQELQPFLRNLDLEESFMVSVPASCCKAKEQRGSFDDVVLQALEQALLDRATQIMAAVSNQSPESVARETAVCNVQEKLALDQTAQVDASAELTAAQKEIDEAAVALKEIEKVAADFDVEIQAASELHEKLRSVQEGFAQGPLASFRTSKDGTVAPELCATAGA